MKSKKQEYNKIIYPDAVYATYITHNSINDFEYKDKSKWPDFGNFLYYKQVPSIGNSGLFYTLDSLLSENHHICKTKIEKLKRLKEGAYFYWGYNGGGRSEIIRRLTSEEIKNLQRLEDIKYEIHINSEEIQKHIPQELSEKKNTLNRELVKHKKLMEKENLL